MESNQTLRHILRGLLVLLVAGGACLVIVASSHKVRAQSRTVEPDLTVHEWGTFTSVAGNDGNAVEWTPLNGIWPAEKPQPNKNVKAVKLSPPARTSELPSFVEHFGFAGFKGGLRGTIRMETPVLYFYTPRDLNVSVQVAFSKGIMTEWYPHASQASGFAGYSSASLYQNHADGTIAWNSVHVEPGLSADFPREPGEHHYYAARETSAAPVRVEAPAGDQHEKFLFYRGVSAASVPVSAKVTSDGKVAVTNPGKDEIPNVILFERRGDKIGYRVGSNVQKETVLNPPELNTSIDSLYGDLEELLTAQGLYRDEAHAMVQTWRRSWFEEGSRLFYIVPAAYVNTILPLTVNPAPAKTVRVFVGRIELVTPATAQAVETALAAHDQNTLNKYERFLEPIMVILREKNPAKMKQLSLNNNDCDCPSTPCESSN